MNRKFSVFIVIMIGMIVASALGVFLFNMVNDHFTGKSKKSEVIAIVKDYLNNKDSANTHKVVGYAFNPAFGKYEVTMNSDNDHNTFQIYVRDDLESLRDSRTEDMLNTKLNDFLVSTYQSEFRELNSEVRVNVMTDNFSQRKDAFWITLIDPTDITKQEFENVSLNILEWISKQDFKLDMFYLDFRNQEVASIKYSLKVDSSNYQDKDLTPYIKEE